MFMPIVGSISNAIKMTELETKWRMRKQNPNLPREGEEDPLVASLKRQAADVRKSSIISSIDSKLKAGAELTDEELSYLKVNCPQLYQEALEIKKEREAYKKELENCRTKKDVEELKFRRLQSFVSQCQAICNNPSLPRAQKQQQMEKILRRLMGIQNEHAKFIKSDKYAALPEEDEKKAKRKKNTPPQPDEQTAPEEEAGREERLRQELEAFFAEGQEGSGRESPPAQGQAAGAPGTSPGDGEAGADAAGADTGPGPVTYTARGQVRAMAPKKATPTIRRQG